MIVILLEFIRLLRVIGRLPTLGKVCLGTLSVRSYQHISGAKVIKIFTRPHTYCIYFMFFYLLLHYETKRKANETVIRRGVWVG